MASLRDILSYYRNYQKAAFLSIAASSVFEIIDLMVPYAVGQILNVLSDQPLDGFVQSLVDRTMILTPFASEKWVSLAVLLGLIFLTTVIKKLLPKFSPYLYLFTMKIIQDASLTGSPKG